MFYGMTPQQYIELEQNSGLHYPCCWDTGKGLVNLSKEGKLVIIDKNGRREHDWYKDAKTGKPWFPKFKNFKSLVNQIIREDGVL